MRFLFSKIIVPVAKFSVVGKPGKEKPSREAGVDRHQRKGKY
jgi:hypothetical protein